jgi:hypothetical protein
MIYIRTKMRIIARATVCIWKQDPPESKMAAVHIMAQVLACLASHPELFMICGVLLLAAVTIIALNEKITIDRYSGRVSYACYPGPASSSANYAPAQPVSKSRRLGRWKQFLVGVVWVVALAQPILGLNLFSHTLARAVLVPVYEA